MSSAVTTFVLNALWQSTLIASAGLALERLCGRPSRRFAVAAGAFVLACLAPLSAWVGGGGTGGGVPGLVIDRRAAWGIAIVETLLIAIAATRLGRRWWRAREIVRSGAVPVPMVVGIVRPVIVLPPYIEIDARLRDAALAHERAHITRRDPLTNFVLELLALPVAFHPAVVLLRRRIHELREMCCDEIAAGVTGGRDYAQALVAIARLATPSPTLAMADQTSIERRIIALRSGPRRGVPFVAAAIVLAIAIACGRGAVRPHVGADLSGTWVLDRKASRVDKRYKSFTQTIRQNGTRLAVTQQRDAKRIAWQIDADGVARPLPGVAKSTSVAVWVDDKLVVDLRAPQQSERAVAWLDGKDAMVAIGEYTHRGTRGSYHAVFRRQR